METDKISETVASVKDGTFAKQIESNAKGIMTGAIIGAVAGLVIATLTGRCKFCVTMWGAIAGSSICYLAAPNEKNFNCCPLI